MPRISWAGRLFLAGMFLSSCSKSPGEIPIELNVEALSAATQDAIEEFVFIADPGGGADSLIFPKGCVEHDCSPTGVSCCFSRTACGFSVKDETEFRLSLPLETIPKGATFTLMACGLKRATDGVYEVLSAGSGPVENTAGKEPDPIPMSPTVTPCSGLPAACP